MVAVTDDDQPDGSGTPPPWGWSAVRERPTGRPTERVLPSVIGAEMAAGLHSPVVPGPAPDGEVATARRDRRTTWGMRVAAAGFASLAGAGLLLTDIGAGLREEVLAQLPDMFVPGPDVGPLEPTAGGADRDPLAAPRASAAPVVPGVLLTPSPGPVEPGPGAPGPGPVVPVDPVDPVVPVDPPVPAPQPPVRDQGPVSSLVDPVVAGTAGLAHDVTGGASGPVTGAVVPVTDGVTDLLDGVVEPVLGLLGGVPRGR